MIGSKYPGRVSRSQVDRCSCSAWYSDERRGWQRKWIRTTGARVMGERRIYSEAEGDETKKKDQVVPHTDHSNIATVLVCL